MGAPLLRDEALEAFRGALGGAHVVTDPAALRSRERATFAAGKRIPAVLYPGDRSEVQACMRIAGRLHVPVYPVSAGRNWGYGSSVPAADECVLISLERMDRIVELDERLAHVTVEPGVTFRRLSDFLRERGSRCTFARTGGSPDGSLIGNALERGIGRGLSGDRLSHVCGLEVVLPSGACLHTGMARFDGASSAALHRWGVGPALDGLFTQSGFGIVTRMTLWLDVGAPRDHSFSFRLRDPARLPGLVEVLRELLLSRALALSVALYNDYRVLSMLEQFPFDPAAARPPSPGDARHRLERRLRGAAWLGEGALSSASEEHARAGLEALGAALRDHVEHLRFREGSARAASRGGSPAGSISSVYWRKRTPVPADPDPDRDGCGVLWCAPVVPFAGEHVARAAELSRATVLAHGFEPGLSVQCVTARCVYLVASILYDREVPGEDERAMACHRALQRLLVDAGYPPYRLGIQDMGALPASSDDYDATVAALRRALDPGGILAPGRYDFGGGGGAGEGP